MEKEQEIIAKATELFLTLGIKSLTMNDVAKKLAISKKTLYQFVSDKDDLVTKCVQNQINRNECEMKLACEKAENAIEELMGFSKVASEKMSRIQPSVFYDLQTYHHKAWSILEEFQNESIKNLTKRNIQRGIDEGLYRNDLNAEIISNIYISIIQGVIRISLTILNQVSWNEYYHEIFQYHVHGIGNEKGIQYINQYLNSDNE